LQYVTIASRDGNTLQLDIREGLITATITSLVMASAREAAAATLSSNI